MLYNFEPDESDPTRGICTKCETPVLVKVGKTGKEYLSNEDGGYHVKQVNGKWECQPAGSTHSGTSYAPRSFSESAPESAESRFKNGMDAVTIYCAALKANGFDIDSDKEVKLKVLETISTVFNTAVMKSK